MIKYVGIGPLGGLSVDSPPTPYINNNPNSGTVRFNILNQNLEVFDGYSWINISTHAEFSLSPEVCEILKWARNKMEHDKKVEDYASRFNIVASFKEQLDEVQEKLDVAIALVSDPN